MKVVESDKVISGMLRDELKRCYELLEGLEKDMSLLPKGVLSERKKRYKDREYSYLSLKFREGNRVINRHIPKEEEEEEGLRGQLARRKKYEKEIRGYRKKIEYLNRLLSGGKRGKTSLRLPHTQVHPLPLLPCSESHLSSLNLRENRGTALSPNSGRRRSSIKGRRPSLFA